MINVYVITNLIDNKQYVGVTNEPDRRLTEHKCGHGSKLVFQAIKKYGWENFKIEFVFEGSEEHATQMEMYLIHVLGTLAHNGYNLTLGGEGTWGWKPSNELRKKWSKQRGGKLNGMYGRTHTEEARKKISEGHKGKCTDLQMAVVCRISQGSKNGHANPVEINGVRYGFLGEAALANGIKPARLRAYVGLYKKTGKWPKSLRNFKIKLL